MAATVAGILLSGDHASRPAAGTPPVGSVYACSDHGLIYYTDGGSWATWADAGAGSLTLAASLTLTGTLADTLAANTDDYAPTGAADALIWRLDASGDYNLTGIVPDRSGQVVMIANVDTTNTITLIHDATSTAANRFLLFDNKNLALKRNGFCLLWYDGTSSRWRMLGGGGAVDFGSPAASAPGDAGSDGVAETAARSDHVHARESYATITAGLDYGEVGDIASSTWGDAAAAGSTGEVADAGHVHAREAKLVSDLTFIIDGGGVVASTGIAIFGVVVDFPCTITGWTVLTDLSATVTIDVWKDTYANHPPTVADTMVGVGTKPNTSAARKGQSTSPDWDTLTLASGDVVFVNLDANDNATWISLTLRVRRDGSA